MQDKGNEMAELFTDPSFLKSMQFKLSTSNVSPGDLFYGGFGPVMAGLERMWWRFIHVFW